MTEIARTSRVEDDPERPGARMMTCLLCGRTSHHPVDVVERSCGACHVFHDDPIAQGEDT